MHRTFKGLALSLALATAVLAPSLTFAQPKPGEAVPPEKLEKAKVHMAAGAAFYDDPSGHKCEEAIREFKTAFELSGSPNAARNLAICALELERDGEAIQYYQEFLTRPKKDPKQNEVDQAERDLKALRSAVAWITVSANEEGVRLTDTRTTSRGQAVINRYVIGKTPIKLGIHPGDHNFVATLEGKQDVTWKIEIVNGTTHTKTLEMQTAVVQGPEKPDIVERPIPVYAWVVGGLTVGILGGWVGTMVWASGEKATFDQQNGTVPVQEATRLRNNVQTANLVADVFLGISAAAVVGTIVVFAVRPERRRKAAFPVLPAPMVGPNAAGGMLIGSF